jgi:hypothetical protein
VDFSATGAGLMPIKNSAALTGRSHLLVIDLLSYSTSHVAINAFWLKHLLERGSFRIIGEADHLAALALESNASVATNPFKKGKGWRLWREFLFIWAIVGHGRGPIFVMGATGLQVLGLALMEMWFPSRARRWLVVLHSEVEGVERPAGIMKAAAGFAIRRLGFPRHMNAVVLGQHIKRNLSVQGLDSERIHVIEHPLPAFELKALRRINGQRPTIAVVGLLRGDTKDLSVPTAVAGEPGVLVRMIGRVGPGYVPPSGVLQDVVESHFSTEWLRDRLKDVDVLLLCPAPERYRYTALGSVCDAITYGRCAAWLRHDALSAYERAPFVICADSVEELVRRIGRFEVPTQQTVEQWMLVWNQTGAQRIHALWDKIGAPRSLMVPGE